MVTFFVISYYNIILYIDIINIYIALCKINDITKLNQYYYLYYNHFKYHKLNLVK